ncbi:Arc-like DNA binding domain protein [Bordetella bronchiseptica 00-P-2730]|uniref:Arc-like DNA binding domain protein n=2 Tax=Bordetella bronchiseptica TaxID=518 RepID=A0ABR4RKI4_BORBO|nr:Arc-like DNA binding domain protein [Bordetella bronchiseptica 00-P-2730]KCV38299.1 Arc-like DNA binding domain protein [Bordetella bronchiseptica 00-P-2796]
MLRLPGDLRARVKAQAARNRRSMNAEIVLMIERGLEKGNAPTAATVGALDVQ